jgi:hypothetical protein
MFYVISIKNSYSSALPFFCPLVFSNVFGIPALVSVPAVAGISILWFTPLYVSCFHLFMLLCCWRPMMFQLYPEGADPTPLSLLVAKPAKIFERGNYPPPPHWDGRTIQPNLIKFRTRSAPPVNESSELTQGGPLVNSLLQGNLLYCCQPTEYIFYC